MNTTAYNAPLGRVLAGLLAAILLAGFMALPIRAGEAAEPVAAANTNDDEDGAGENDEQERSPEEQPDDNPELAEDPLPATDEDNPSDSAAPPKEPADAAVSVLSTEITIDSVSDLERAINDFNSSATADTVMNLGDANWTVRTGLPPITGTHTLTLTNHGGMLSFQNTSDSAPMLEVGDGASLVLDDILLSGNSGGQAHTIKGPLLHINNGGTATIKGASRITNARAQACSVVEVQGTLYLTGESAVSSNYSEGNDGVVYVNGGRLVIDDGFISNNEAVRSAVYIANGATAVMTGGSTINVNSGINLEKGVAVYVADSGHFQMSGGSLISNIGHGLAVHGTAAMDGGQIVNNKDLSGGGVFVGAGGVFTLMDGEIYNNTAPSGAGVYVADTGLFEMSGNASIYHNAGDGVSVARGGRFEMDGRATIRDNTGSGLVVRGDAVMNNGLISRNTAPSGGGVCIGSTGEFTMNAGEICFNTADYGGGVTAYLGGKFHMNDGYIGSNTAHSQGGGVYLTTSGEMIMSGGYIADDTSGDGREVRIEAPGALHMTGGIIFGLEGLTQSPVFPGTWEPDAAPGSTGILLRWSGEEGNTYTIGTGTDLYTWTAGAHAYWNQVKSFTDGGVYNGITLQRGQWTDFILVPVNLLGGSGGSNRSSGGGISSAPTAATGAVRVTLTHGDTGVVVSGLLPAGAALTVLENHLHPADSGCEACAEIRALRRAGTLLVQYDISVGGFTQGSVDVSIPVAAAYAGQSLTILHCNNRQLESRTVTVKNGKVTRSFASLSPFAVALPHGAQAGPAATGANGTGGPDAVTDTHNPSTGGALPDNAGSLPRLWLCTLLPAAALALGVAGAAHRRSAKGR